MPKRPITVIDMQKLAYIQARMAQLEAKIAEEIAMNATANALLSGIAAGQATVIAAVQLISTTINTGFALAKTFYEWSGMDRVVRIFTFVCNVNTFVFVCNDVINVILKVISNIATKIGFKDYKGQPIDLSKIIGTGIEDFFKFILGVQTVKDIEKYYASANRIYQATANVLTAVQSIGNTAFRACGIVNNQLGDLATAMKKWRLVGKDAYAANKKNIDFQSPLYTSLKSVETMVKGIDEVASSTANQIVTTITNASGTVTTVNKEVSKIEKIISDETSRFNVEYQTDVGETVPEHKPTADRQKQAIANSTPPKDILGSISNLIKKLGG